MGEPPTNHSDFDAIARRNQRTGVIILAVVLGMVALSFAAVPLYRIFCQVTGVGGPAQRLVAAQNLPSTVRDRMVDIRFNTDVDGTLPWTFKPTDHILTVNVGAEGMTAFTARNDSGAPITGTAVYNVLPEKAGPYVHKVQCFCFGEQRLNPGQSVHMPVLFYVDPAFADDPNMQDVRTITLSYIFYRTDSKRLDAALQRLQQ